MLMFVIFGAVLLLMLLGVSTAVTMGFASIATFLFAGGDPTRLFLVPQRMFAQVSGITLMSIPFFLLMGNLMTVGGVSKSLFGFGRVCLGHRWGGLSNAAIVACVVMAAMSGSAAACAAGIGMIAINEMTKSGYGRPFSCATIAAGGALGPIIPPSITLILYAGLTQTSVNSLFAAGAVPGLLLGIMFMGWSSWVSARRNYAKTEPAPWRERLQAFREAFFALDDPRHRDGRHVRRHLHGDRSGRRRVPLRDVPRLLRLRNAQGARPSRHLLEHGRADRQGDVRHCHRGLLPVRTPLHPHSAAGDRLHVDLLCDCGARAPSHHRAPRADGLLHGGHGHPPHRPSRSSCRLPRASATTSFSSAL